MVARCNACWSHIPRRVRRLGWPRGNTRARSEPLSRYELSLRQHRNLRVLGHIRRDVLWLVLFPDARVELLAADRRIGSDAWPPDGHPGGSLRRPVRSTHGPPATLDHWRDALRTGSGLVLSDDRADAQFPGRLVARTADGRRRRGADHPIAH